MKGKRLRLSQRYGAALQKHVKMGPRMGLSLARGLGKQAAGIGLRALDLARMHDQALAELVPLATENRALKRADAFFLEAFKPLEQTSPSACKAAATLQKLKQTLRARTTELARSQRTRKQEVVYRSAMTAALRRKKEHCDNLLAKSRDLQSLTRRILLAQEDDRARISRKLYDDVAQEMLGIQVRLTHFKKRAARNTVSFKQHLDVAQRLVENSAKTVRRIARSLGAGNES